MTVRKNNSGVVLLIVLWILVILTVLALSLARRTTVDLALAKHHLHRLKAKHLAWAGVMGALDQIRLDSDDDEAKNFDTLFLCGVVRQPAEDLEKVFLKRNLGDGYFDVGYSGAGDRAESLFPGMVDEESKININALDIYTTDILKELLMILDVSEADAQTIVFSILDWKDEDNDLIDDNFGAEEAYYVGANPPYKAKNRLFDSLEELFLVRGMTQDIFNRIRNDITVFPKEGGRLEVNFDTASENVLLSLARSFSGDLTNTETADADSLVSKLLEYRSGLDGLPRTEDDRAIEINEVQINAKERAVFLSMNTYRTKVSNYFRVRSRGVVASSRIEANVMAVIRRDDLSFADWQSNEGKQ